MAGDSIIDHYSHYIYCDHEQKKEKGAFGEQIDFRPSYVLTFDEYFRSSYFWKYISTL